METNNAFNFFYEQLKNDNSEGFLNIVLSEESEDCFFVINDKNKISVKDVFLRIKDIFVSKKCEKDDYLTVCDVLSNILKLCDKNNKIDFIFPYFYKLFFSLDPNIGNNECCTEIFINSMAASCGSIKCFYEKLFSSFENMTEKNYFNPLMILILLKKVFFLFDNSNDFDEKVKLSIKKAVKRNIEIDYDIRYFIQQMIEEDMEKSITDRDEKERYFGKIVESYYNASIYGKNALYLEKSMEYSNCAQQQPHFSNYYFRNKLDKVHLPPRCSKTNEIVCIDYATKESEEISYLEALYKETNDEIMDRFAIQYSSESNLFINDKFDVQLDQKNIEIASSEHYVNLDDKDMKFPYKTLEKSEGLYGKENVDTDIKEGEGIKFDLGDW